MCYVDMFYFVQTLTSHLNIYRYLFHVIVEIKEENFLSVFIIHIEETYDKSILCKIFGLMI